MNCEIIFLSLPRWQILNRNIYFNQVSENYIAVEKSMAEFCMNNTNAEIMKMKIWKALFCLIPLFWCCFIKQWSYEAERSLVHVIYTVSMLFQTSKRRAVETTDITKSFGWDSSEGIYLLINALSRMNFNIWAIISKSIIYSSIVSHQTE